tara:strand:- start:247 stop:747 length:501 start_codon:yes stop_codon:yes gene_type:complete
MTATDDVKKWISEFVTKPNPVFGNLPPCPFAQKAILDDKVEFLELDGVADYPTLYGHIFNFDFETKDVLCMIAQPDHFTADETVKLAEDLNNHFMRDDIVVLEDHPEIKESVKEVQLNNGTYILFLVQSLSKLNKFADMLRNTDYYKNWDPNYEKEVTGPWRRPSK